jgi:hypothetical protein
MNMAPNYLRMILWKISTAIYLYSVLNESLCLILGSIFFVKITTFNHQEIRRCLIYFHPGKNSMMIGSMLNIPLLFTNYDIIAYFLNLAFCSEHFISIKHRILASFTINKQFNSDSWKTTDDHKHEVKVKWCMSEWHVHTMTDLLTIWQAYVVRYFTNGTKHTLNTVVTWTMHESRLWVTVVAGKNGLYILECGDKNVDIRFSTSFWNNFHLVRSKSETALNMHTYPPMDRYFHVIECNL